MQAYGRLRSTTFSSLGIRNYRLYFFGQAVSLSGTWMQTIAQGLLVLRLSGSGTSLGVVTALQTLPVLLLGPWGGVIADRFPKRSTLMVTQVVSCCLALTLGILVGTDLIRIWMVYILAAGLGTVTAIDNPTRQTFVLEMVGKDQLANAVSLNAIEINLTRVIGPSLAGVLVATIGLSACFLFNGLSYLAVIASLLMMNADELLPAPLIPRARGQLAEAIGYVRRTRVLLTPLVMMAIIGTFTYEYSVILPIFAKFTFDDGASGYAALTASMGAGAVVGGFFTASRRPGGQGLLLASALCFGVADLLLAAAPTLLLAMAALVIVGFFSISFTSIGNVTVQTNSGAAMRGRIMALWTVAFLGSTPIGGPLIGAIGEHVGPRWGIATGGIAAILAAGIGWLLLRQEPRDEHVARTQPAAIATGSRD